MLTFNSWNDVLATAETLVQMEVDGPELVTLMRTFRSAEPTGRWSVLYAETARLSDSSSGETPSGEKVYRSTALVELRTQRSRRVHVGRASADCEVVSHARAVFAALAELLEIEVYPFGRDPDPRDLLMHECILL